jgi:AraC family transcriptional regulator, regulatory protein of adaptative response / DNA-3-methyladenine glycosylase II
MGPVMDAESCYRAVQSRDGRFDGWFVTAVSTTSIYCRPSCPAIPPKRANVRFYPTAAAAQGAGFRACKRCRPDATPGSPEWNVRDDVVGRAMRLIGDGVVDREGVGGLAARLGYSERHLHRQLVAGLGAGPLALARAQRAQTARLLLETTDLRASDVAFAAGFTSIRQFNDTVREVYAVAPTALRTAAAWAAEAPGRIVLRLPYRAPIDLPGLFTFLAARAVPGVEEGTPAGYRRTLRLPHGSGVVELSAGPPAGAPYVRAVLRLEDLRDLGAAVARCRRLLDLDADPAAVDAQLGTDPLLAPLVAAAPGRRSPGHVDGPELAVHAVLGQQVSVAGARTLAARLVARHGDALPVPDGALTALFPTPAALAAADPADLPVPGSRRRALLALTAALAEGSLTLDPGVDRDEAERALLALPGIGPWTAGYVRLRALGDPDAFLPGDLGVRHALARCGRPADARAAREMARAWRPWRAYALHCLWSVPPPGSRPGSAAAVAPRTEPPPAARTIQRRSPAQTGASR